VIAHVSIGVRDIGRWRNPGGGSNGFVWQKNSSQQTGNGTSKCCVTVVLCAALGLNAIAVILYPLRRA
jgi:hypothetical protein